MPASIVNENSLDLENENLNEIEITAEEQEKIDKLLVELEAKEVEIINDLYSLHFKQSVNQNIDDS